MKPSEIMLNSKIPNKNKFGIYLKSRRREFNFTIREFAEQLNISPAYACDIENGNRNAPLQFLEKAINCLKIETSEIPYFYDLANYRQSNWPDINEYLAKTPNAREFLRIAKQKKLSDEDLSTLILSIDKPLSTNKDENYLSL